MAEPTILTRIRFEGLDDIKAAFADMQKSFEASADRMRRAGEKVGDGLKKGVDGATAAVRTTGTVGARSFGLLKAAAHGFLDILKSGVSFLVSLGKAALDVAGKVAVAGAAAFAAVQAFGITTGQSIDELGRLADAAGVPVQRFSRLATATRLLGGDVSDLGSGMQSLSEKILDAAKDGNGAGAKAFAQLGVSVRDANGGLKSTEQVLNEVADGLAQVPKDSLRASAATDIFGGAARALLPILQRGSKGLEEYASKSDRLGTVVTATQAKTARGLLVQYRMVGEALRGIAYRIGDDLLPFLTQNSQKLAEWLADNADSISAFTGRVLKEIAGISADLGKAIVGDGASIEREWVKKLVPAIATARDVLLDLLDIFTGGSATRAPWLKDIGKALRDAASGAKELGREIVKAAGFGDAKLPTLKEAAIAVAEAFRSLRAGIEGRGEIKVKWAANVGETLKNVGSAVGSLAGIIVDHREEITRFFAGLSGLVASGMAAVKALLNGEDIAKENPFSFLNGWRDTAKAIYERIVHDAKWLTDQVLAIWGQLKEHVQTEWAWLDWIAKKIGLNGAVDLALVLLIDRFTGIIDVIKDVVAIGAAVVFSVKNITSTFTDLIKIGGSVVGWVKWLGQTTAFKAFASAATAAFEAVGTGVVALAAVLGLPVEAVVAIGVAIAALAAAVWYYWDDIVKASKWLWQQVQKGFDAMLDGVVAVWDSIEQSASDAWDSVVKTWGDFKDWIAGIFDDAKKALVAFWDWMTSAPGQAWDTLVDTWKGFTGFFGGLVDKVKGYFKSLWDGVKNGAADAWNSVKSAFGFGGDNAPDGTADKSPKLATGGIVRGPGGPVGDRIRAWLSDGEGVLNAKAVGHYGESFVHALNNLLVPQGLGAGSMVPALASASGPSLGSLHLGIGGKSVGGSIYGDADAMRSLRRDFRDRATASRGRLPRWRGA